MTYTRRTFLVGAGSGLGVLLLAACTNTPPAPVYTPEPTATAPVPQPDRFLRSTWASDPFSRGTHSFIALGSTPEHRATLAEPIDGRVFFAGEATDDDRPATVLGARSSGARAAGQVIQESAEDERIAVIGAGIAGAEAARLIAESGRSVVVVEARDRIGGRIHSVESPDWPVTVQQGAWLFKQETDASLLGTLERQDIDTVELEPAQLFRGVMGDEEIVATPEPSSSADGTVTAAVEPNPVGAEAVASALAWAADQLDDVALADSLTESGASGVAGGTSRDGIDGAALLQQFLAVLAVRSGADPDELSSWYPGVVPWEPSVAVSGDLATLVTTALEGIETFLSTAVVGVTGADDAVSLRRGTGESLAVDRVVVTAPLGVLKEGGIEFEPPLPFSHRSAISELGFGDVETVWLSYDQPFWSTDASVWHVVGGEGPVTTWVNLLPSTGEAVLVGLVGGDAARGFADLDDDGLVQAVVRSLRPFAG